MGLAMTASPKASAVRALLLKHQLTQRGAAMLIYATHRAMQEWCGGRRVMPPAKWELLQLKVAAKRASADTTLGPDPPTVADKGKARTVLRSVE
jgi:hypothetical protein